jgi:hypothetical protein
VLLPGTELQTITIHRNYHYNDIRAMMDLTKIVQKALDGNQVLRTLPFLPIGDWGFSDECAYIFATVIRTNSTLQEFHIGYDTMESMVIFAESLAINTSLHTLALSCDYFTTDGLVTAFESVQHTEMIH